MRWPVLVATIATAVTAEGGDLFGSDARGEDVSSAVATEQVTPPVMPPIAEETPARRCAKPADRFVE